VICSAFGMAFFAAVGCSDECSDGGDGWYGSGSSTDCATDSSGSVSASCESACQYLDERCFSNAEYQGCFNDCTDRQLFAASTGCGSAWSLLLSCIGDSCVNADGFCLGFCSENFTPFERPCGAEWDAVDSCTSGDGGDGGGGTGGTGGSSGTGGSKPLQHCEGQGPNTFTAEGLPCGSTTTLAVCSPDPLPDGYYWQVRCGLSCTWELVNQCECYDVPTGCFQGQCGSCR